MSTSGSAARRKSILCLKTCWIVGFGLTFMLRSGFAAELVQPPVCSATTAGDPALKDVCIVTPLGGSRNDVKVNLTATSAQIDVGGYKVTTGNYNGNFLTPIVEAMPGDTVSAHLVNMLPAAASNGGTHDHTGNPTNLHYFHGGIVSPNNSRPAPAELGNGDNVYVDVKSGSSFDFKVPIPGDKSIPGNEMLDARVLESQGFISHPRGLNWYHSHRHGISANQVMGGMSGLLSVGQAKDNVKAICNDPNVANKCSDATEELKRATKVQYALLRDIPVMNIAKLPGDANGDKADWDLDDAARDFSKGAPGCGVWKADNSGLDLDHPGLRLGFCQRAKDKAVLFTVNGQRFPTIIVKGGENLLLRLGNLSANFPYWLELQDEADPTKHLPITILSLDGVVPAAPTAPGQVEKPVQAVDYPNVLVMPAMRAEIYVRNDQKRDAPKVYILKTRRHAVKLDDWPEIQLARIELEANSTSSEAMIALNAPVAVIGPPHFLNQAAPAPPPPGCVRDLKPEALEFRRVTFMGFGSDWSVKTEIVTPAAIQQPQSKHLADPAATIAAEDGTGLPFEAYVGKDGTVDWTKPNHVCIFLDHAGSHQQLWVLVNSSPNLHNFHIHQMKFRLATTKDLTDHHITPPALAHTCAQDPCPGDAPNYDLYDDQQTPAGIDPGATRRWHDTIPLPPDKTKEVYVVMSFDASQQVGRFVFHCHILKHEDNGLMAPIEVIAPGGLALQ